MTVFRKLDVYRLTRSIVKDIYLLLKNPAYDRNLKDQLLRASTSIMLNIAEGSGRWFPRDQRRYFNIARGSALECIAIFDIIEDLKLLPIEEANDYKKRLDKIARMLFGIIQHFGKMAQADDSSNQKRG